MGELDFIVLGVARSGTTAFSRFLNSIAGVTCGLEYFSFDFDHNKIRSPEFFVGDEYKKNPFGRDIVANSLKQNENLPTLYGNKIPNYFYRVDTLMESVRGNRVFYCYRDVAECVKSASTRAKNPNDPWERSRTGLFCILDFVWCLKKVVASRSSIFVVPNLHMRTNPEKLLEEVKDILGINANRKIDLNAVDQLKKNSTRVGKAPSSTVFSYSELSLLSSVPYLAINEILNRNRLYNFDEVRGEIHNVMNNSFSNFLDLFEAELDSPELIMEKKFYHERYKKRFRISS